MENRSPVHDITDKVPSEAIRQRFGVKDRSIRLARERGVFPASWYRGMKDLCAEYDTEFSDDAFNWKSPTTEDNSAPAIKRGSAETNVQAQSIENNSEARS